MTKNKSRPTAMPVDPPDDPHSEANLWSLLASIDGHLKQVDARLKQIEETAARVAETTATVAEVVVPPSRLQRMGRFLKGE